MNELAQEKLSQRAILWGGLAITGTVGLVLCAQFALSQGFALPCMFLSVTGIPCPTCGSTRALAALGQLDVLAAVRLNPLFVTSMACVPVAAVGWKRITKMGTGFWVCLAGLVLLNWGYLWFYLPR